jgi:hypothetical protein
MDMSEASKLLKLFNLNKTLESLSCNEDSNVKDSLFSKSTSVEAEENYACASSIFGESKMSLKEEANPFDEELKEKSSVFPHKSQDAILHIKEFDSIEKRNFRFKQKAKTKKDL